MLIIGKSKQNKTQFLPSHQKKVKCCVFLKPITELIDMQNSLVVFKDDMFRCKYGKVQNRNNIYHRDKQTQ